MGYQICFYMLPALFRLLVHTSCIHVVLYLNPVWNRALFEERFAHQQCFILTSISYLGVTSQNSETLTCYVNINFILAEFKQSSEKNQGAYFIWFLQAENWSLMWFSCSVLSNSLQPHRLQHAGLPCSSPSTRVCSNSCSLCWWCYPTISSSVIPFSSCPQSLKLKLLEGRVHTAYGLLDSIFFARIFLCIFSSVSFPSYNSK